MQPKKLFIEMLGGMVDDFAERADAMRRTLNDFGLRARTPHAFYTEMNGLLERDMSPREIFNAYGIGTSALLAQRIFEDYYIESLKRVRPFPGVPEALRYLKRYGTTIILILGTEQPVYRQLLKRLAMEDAITAMITSRCASEAIRFVWRVKPDQFGPRAKPEECVFMSGNPWSLTDAKETGVKTFALHKDPEIIPNKLIGAANPTVLIRTFPIGPIEI